MPLISVVIPIFNVEKYLKRCVDSLLCQNFSDCEIILVDDGSTDASGSIADQLQKDNEIVVAFHKKNGGLADARNFGMGKATGKYVVFVDSDDCAAPRYFQFLTEHLQGNIDVFKFGYQKMNNGVPGKITVPCYDEGIYDREHILSDILPGAVGPVSLFDYNRVPVLSAWASAYSMDFLKKNRIVFQSERKILNEDHLFNFQVLLKAETVAVSHEALYLYDFREGSLSKRYIQNMVERKTSLLSCYQRLLSDEGLYERYEIPYYSKCIDSFYACIINECSRWNTEGTALAVKRIRDILNLELCREAFHKVGSRNLTKKGWIIYTMMKYKMALTMFFMYRAMKGPAKE